MKSIVYNFLLVMTLLLPRFAAASSHQPDDFKDMVWSLTDFVLKLVPILAGVALLLFFWGLVEYVFAAGDQQVIEDSRQRIVWGIVGLFTIGAIWGIVKFLGGALSVI